MTDAERDHYTAERDDYTWDLECPSCKLKGFATTSEDAIADVRSLQFSVDEISPGFRLNKYGALASDTEIVCAACNGVV